eukprot:gene16124-22268_t
MSQRSVKAGAASRPGTAASSPDLLLASAAAPAKALARRPGSSSITTTGPPDSWTMNNLAALCGDPNALSQAQYSTPTRRKGRFQPQAMAIPSASSLIAVNQPSPSQPTHCIPGLTHPSTRGSLHSQSYANIELQLGRTPSALKAAPTRGMMYSVFHELDSFGVGKLTYTLLEQAGVQIGLTLESVKGLYDM